jgi:site-specific DNA-cytosine methylase
MTAYYNEYDAKAAAWLRELIKSGLIAPGEVDERSIADVRPEELKDFTQCHFFAGIGGWSYALRLAGWADDRPCWTGSPPCQPFSVAGKRKAQADTRHLWPVFFNLIRECQPTNIFGEQVEAAIRTGWLDDLQDDLEAEGYATGKIVLPACSVGAPHIRQRIWFVAERLADTQSDGSQRRIFGRENPQWCFINRSIGCNGTACEFCGYEFDIELLGKYGCPNCEGCGLANTASDGHAAPDGLREKTKPSEQTWAKNIGQSKGSSNDSGLAEPNNDRCGEGQRNGQATGHGNTFASEGSNGGVDDSESFRPRFRDPKDIGPANAQINVFANAGDCESDKPSREQPSTASADAPEAFWSAPDWLYCRDGKWRPAPTECKFLLLADGFWYRMDDVLSGLIKKALQGVEDYAEITGTRPEEVLRSLWKADGTEAIQREAARPWSVFKDEVLRAILRGKGSMGEKPESEHTGQQKKVAEADRRMLRDLQSQIESEHPSLRWKPTEQRQPEPANLVSELSQFLAQCEQAYGAYGARKNEGGFPLAGKCVGRVGLLRGYGNAIVPQVAAEVIKAYMEAGGHDL